MQKLFTMAMTFVAFFLFSQNSLQSSCDNLKTHEFDFWIGEWTVYKAGTDKIVGYNSIIPVAGGCGIQESWKAANGTNVGTSLNKYNFTLGKWQQFWIDNAGQTLELQGSYSGNKMILESLATVISDKPIPRNKITWFNNADGTVRQLWEQTIDGKTWTVAFDGLYKKMR